MRNNGNRINLGHSEHGGLDFCPSQHAFFIPPNYGYRLAAGHNGKWDYVKAPQPFPCGWHHVAVTYDEASRTMKLYQDGKPVASNSTVPPFNSPNGLMQVGRYDKAHNLVGEMKKITVWNHARSDEEILASYDANKEPAKTGEEVKIGDELNGEASYSTFSSREKEAMTPVNPTG